MKRKIIRIMSIVLLVSTAFTMLMGCSTKEIPDVEKVLSSALSNQEEVRLISETGAPVFELAKGETAKLIMSKIAFEVKDAKAKKDTATAKVSFTYPDIIKLSEQYDEDNKENFSEWISKQLDSEYPTKTKKINVKMKLQDDGNWYLIITEEFENVVSGGIFDYVKDTEKEAYKAFAKGAK